jgi:hypothetical protein
MLQNRKLLTKPLTNSFSNAWAYENTWHADDFSSEIEGTRANELLMAHLRLRAQQPATVSLEELRRDLLGFQDPESR